MVSKEILGAGKTNLVKGTRGLGITEPITSPTFTLVCEYEGRLKLEHLDFYRLENDDQILTSGLEPYFQPEGIAVIEWFNCWTGPRPADFRHVTPNKPANTNASFVMKIRR